MHLSSKNEWNKIIEIRESEDHVTASPIDVANAPYSYVAEIKVIDSTMGDESMRRSYNLKFLQISNPLLYFSRFQCPEVDHTWALVEVSNNKGTGAFSDITYIQIVNTAYGNSPAKSECCGKYPDGNISSIPTHGTFLFYKKC
ncbi:10357_t:CDS:2 [Dentiscutata erythropus]|uniref:10357_t:CDS:1 n=1 Tax=Dentiscutata erythropus TaxID=1348616 RepID=A0A9N8ZJH4_9GLOM|nr:10357_t:CDS:2 [Dentiscutata erythropus]